MKGNITLFILKAIQAGANTMNTISDAINEDSISNTMRRFYGGMKKEIWREPLFKEKIAELEKRQRISKLITKLKSEGLIIKDKKGFLNTNEKGIKKIKQLEKRREAQKNYISKISGDTKIITFDIPEHSRIHREWLRGALKQLKFTMLQKSVWVGKMELPENFLDDMGARDISDFVEIFAVTKSGTLKQL